MGELLRRGDDQLGDVLLGALQDGRPLLLSGRAGVGKQPVGLLLRAEQAFLPACVELLVCGRGALLDFFVRRLKPFFVFAEGRLAAASLSALWRSSSA